jgi:glyoxylase-like metal-dependent hydrolase (beta-lactamase superfamily II)
VNITVDEIAPGVWYLAGQTHHSVAIEMLNEVLLVEAPQNDARTLAVIARARALRPAKPVRTLVNTHHHFDHSGGVRAAMSEGLTIVTHAGNKAFFDSLGARRHFIEQDALARARRAPRVEGVTDKQVISDAARTVELHAVRGSPHSATILMVYVPAERLLIEADLYSPPAAGAPPAPAPFVAELVRSVDRLGLAVDRVVPLHGRVIPMDDVRAAARVAEARGDTRGF